MTVKSKNTDGSVGTIACGMGVRAATDKIRKLNGTTIWRVVAISDYNVVLRCTKPDDSRTLYFSAPTFLHYWKPVSEEHGGKNHPLIGDRVVGKDHAVVSHYGQAAFKVIGLDGPYVVLEREHEDDKRARPVEWLAKNFWVCFERAK